jgi:hypothetical protein
MPLAIHTRYHGLTETRGSRISATCRRGDKTYRVYLPFPHDLHGEACHEAAAKLLQEEHLQFTADWPHSSLNLAGETLDGRGFVFAIDCR